MSRAVDVYWILGHSELQNVAYCEMMPYIDSVRVELFILYFKFHKGKINHPHSSVDKTQLLTNYNKMFVHLRNYC